MSRSSTRRGLEALLEPVGEITVDLPSDVTDASGETVAEAGAATIDAEQAAAILTARDPDVPGARQYGAAAAVWSGVAAAIGDGLAAEGAPDTGAAAPLDSVDDLVERLFGGRVGYRSLRSTAPEAADNPRDVDVAVLDPVELTLVFGQIAPAAVAAPNAGLTFRVVSSYSDEQLAASGRTNTDVAYAAISALQFIGANVVSVTTSGEAPGERSRIETADQSLVPGTEAADVLFGALDVTVGERPIAGVDAVLTLGTAYLDLLASVESPSTVPPPTAPTSAPPTSSESTGD